MSNLREALQTIHDLRQAGLIADYAIGGAMAQIFWTEAIPTFDLDVIVVLPPSDSVLVDIEPLYAWARGRGYPIKAEHIEIGQVPVQFLPAYSALAEEAVKAAKELDYSGLPVRVITPEYLIALALEGSAKTYRRKERAFMLRETAQINHELLQDIMRRYNLSW